MLRRLRRAAGALAGIGAVLAILSAGCGQAKRPGSREGSRGSAPGSGESAKTYSLTYSIFFPATHIQYKMAEGWARDVETRTQGRIQIAIHADGSLLEPTKTYDGVVQGVADIGMGCFAYTRGRFPLLEGLDLPLGYPDGKTATTIANTILAKYAPKEVGDVHVLYVHAHGPGVLATRKPVATLAAIKGLKVRATGLSGRIVEKLGGSAVGMPQNETYEALRKDVVDATLCPVEALQGWRQSDVIESITPLPTIGYTTTLFVVMNKARWEALPADLQQTLTNASREWAVKHGEAWDQADVAGLAFITGLGKKVQNLPPADAERARDAVKAILDDYVKTTEAAGLPGAQVLDDIRQQMKDVAAPK
jgi:TRAP-type C4-dicarboxylate transport system substrate-binding protein